MLHNMIMKHTGQAELGNEEEHWIQCNCEVDDERIARDMGQRNRPHRESGSGFTPHLHDFNDNVNELQDGHQQLTHELVEHYTYMFQQGKILWKKTWMEVSLASVAGTESPDI